MPPRPSNMHLKTIPALMLNSMSARHNLGEESGANSVRSSEFVEHIDANGGDGVDGISTHRCITYNQITPKRWARCSPSWRLLKQARASANSRYYGHCHALCGKARTAPKQEVYQDGDGGTRSMCRSGAGAASASGHSVMPPTAHLLDSQTPLTWRQELCHQR